MTKHMSIPIRATETTGTIVIQCDDLRTVLTSVKEFATEDDMREALHGVWLMARTGRLHVAAFNPYCAAFDSVVAVEVKEDFNALLPLGIVKTLMRDLKSLKKDLRTTGRVVLEFTSGGGVVTYPQENRRKVQQHWVTGPVLLPDYEKILPTGRGEPTPHISLNLHFIEMCLNSGRYMGNFVFRGPLAPVELSSETFYAVIMPLRVPSPV